MLMHENETIPAALFAYSPPPLFSMIYTAGFNLFNVSHVLGVGKGSRCQKKWSYKAGPKTDFIQNDFADPHYNNVSKEVETTSKERIEVKTEGARAIIVKMLCVYVLS